MSFEFIQVSPEHRPGVALVRLNRPKELNALNRGLMIELVAVLRELEADGNTRVVVLTGSDKAFAAGADIKEMSNATAIEMYNRDQFAIWDSIKKIKIPIIAAVSGFALGGGCELCMLCDMIVAAENAQFGQPEIKLGIIPGAGGTQRLTRAIGKARAMEIILTGKFISAQEAYDAGLLTRVVPNELYLHEAVKLAEQIAGLSPIAVRVAKDTVLKAFDVPLDEGLQYERRNFYLLFASEDQKEGMRAFVEKRPANWTGK